MLLILHAAIVHQLGCWQLPSRIKLETKYSFASFFFFRQFLYIEEISFLDTYDIHWAINHADLREAPVILRGKQVIQILVQVSTQNQSSKVVRFILFLHRQRVIVHLEKKSNTKTSWKLRYHLPSTFRSLFSNEIHYLF